jgi:hypothetical protein
MTNRRVATLAAASVAFLRACSSAPRVARPALDAGTLRTYQTAKTGLSLLPFLCSWPHRGFNRTIKQIKRTGCGFRNMTNYRRRIVAHIAVTRPALQAAC